MDTFNDIQSDRYIDRSGLFIESRQLSWVVATFVLASFFIFLAGYRAGKQQVAQYKSVPPSTIKVLSDDIQENSSQNETITRSIPRLQSERYYAQLASFDSMQEAQELVQTLKAIEIETSIKERGYTLASGEKKTWYQVVTSYFQNKHELENLVETVSKQKSLHEICFMCC